MTASELLTGTPLLQEIPAAIADRQVRALAYDSRRAQADSLFFAFPGAKADGRRFAAAAVEKLSLIHI